MKRTAFGKWMAVLCAGVLFITAFPADKIMAEETGADRSFEEDQSCVSDSYGNSEDEISVTAQPISPVMVRLTGTGEAAPGKRYITYSVGGHELRSDLVAGLWDHQGGYNDINWLAWNMMDDRDKGLVHDWFADSPDMAIKQFDHQCASEILNYKGGENRSNWRKDWDELARSINATYKAPLNSYYSDDNYAATVETLKKYSESGSFATLADGVYDTDKVIESSRQNLIDKYNTIDILMSIGKKAYDCVCTASDFAGSEEIVPVIGSKQSVGAGAMAQLIVNQKLTPDTSFYPYPSTVSICREGNAKLDAVNNVMDSFIERVTSTENTSATGDESASGSGIGEGSVTSAEARQAMNSLAAKNAELATWCYTTAADIKGSLESNANNVLNGNTYGSSTGFEGYLNERISAYKTTQQLYGKYAKKSVDLQSSTRTDIEALPEYVRECTGTLTYSHQYYPRGSSEPSRYYEVAPNIGYSAVGGSSSPSLKLLDILKKAEDPALKAEELGRELESDLKTIYSDDVADTVYRICVKYYANRVQGMYGEISGDYINTYHLDTTGCKDSYTLEAEYDTGYEDVWVQKDQDLVGDMAALTLLTMDLTGTAFSDANMALLLIEQQLNKITDINEANSKEYDYDADVYLENNVRKQVNSHISNYESTSFRGYISNWKWQAEWFHTVDHTPDSLRWKLFDFAGWESDIGWIRVNRKTYIPVTAIAKKSDAVLRGEGDRTRLEVSVTPSDATDKGMRWDSSDPDVAIVDQNGYVTALSPGTATITARALDGLTPRKGEDYDTEESKASHGSYGTAVVGFDCPKELTAAFTVTVGDEAIDGAPCVISFDGNGQKGCMEPVELALGSKYTLPKCGFTSAAGGGEPDDEDAGRLFDRWDLGEPGQTITITGDTQITARWRFRTDADDPDHLYSITAQRSGIGIYRGSERILEAKTGETIRLVYEDIPDSGERFKNWIVTGAECKDPESEITTFTVGTKDVTISYETMPIPVYTVIFNKNDGSDEKTSQTIPTKETVRLDANAFVREGYKFMGWALTPDANTAVYGDRAAVRDLAEADGTRNLYAVWKQTGISYEEDEKPEYADDTTAVSKLQFKKSSLKILYDDTESNPATPTMKSGEAPKVYYTTTNRDIVSVNEDGTFYAVGIGTATVTAHCGTKKATCKVEVLSYTKDFIIQDIDGGDVTEDQIPMKAGGQQLLSVVIEPEESTDPRAVAWRSSNAKAVKISGGLITACEVKNTETAVITATVKKTDPSTGKLTSVSHQVSVIVEPVEIPAVSAKDKTHALAIKKSSLKMETTYGRNTFPLDITVTPKGKNPLDEINLVSVMSTNDDVVTVSDPSLEPDTSGKKGMATATLTAMAPGTAYIIISSQSAGSEVPNVKKCKVTVTCPASGIVVSEEQITMRRGSYQYIEASVIPEFSTDAPKLKMTGSGGVTVKNGLVYAKSLTKDKPAKILLKCGKVTRMIEVTVTK